MSNLSLRERELVALAASLASNCVPCIETHIAEARKGGLLDTEIAEAITLADQVRQVPARKVLKVAATLLPALSTEAPAGVGSCAAPASGMSACADAVPAGMAARCCG
jgi:AhpD family alkylhydroperoxidase